MAEHESAKDIVARILAHDAINNAESLDMLYDELDNRCVAKQYQEADELLRAMADSDLRLAHLYSALICTNPWYKTLREAREYVGEKARPMVLANQDEMKHDGLKYLNALLKQEREPSPFNFQIGAGEHDE